MTVTYELRETSQEMTTSTAATRVKQIHKDGTHSADNSIPDWIGYVNIELDWLSDGNQCGRA